MGLTRCISKFPVAWDAWALWCPPEDFLCLLWVIYAEMACSTGTTMNVRLWYDINQICWFAKVVCFVM